mmetsp:Transcript_20850/g.23589  ORF Transcript_20850/g.23589 Transcript_20850/m.23589 type:complete len:93 (-) Transcript_20850:1059-1337(-)
MRGREGGNIERYLFTVHNCTLKSEVIQFSAGFLDQVATSVDNYRKRKGNRYVLKTSNLKAKSLPSDEQSLITQQQKQICHEMKRRKTNKTSN